MKVPSFRVTKRRLPQFEAAAVFLYHVFKLAHIQVVIEALLCHQLLCISFFDDVSVGDDEDTVRLLDSGKPVGDDEGSSAL